MRGGRGALVCGETIRLRRRPAHSARDLATRRGGFRCALVHRQRAMRARPTAVPFAEAVRVGRSRRRLRRAEGSCGRYPVPADADRAHHRDRKPGDPRAGCAELLGRRLAGAALRRERAHRDLSRDAISLAINSETRRARRTSCTSTSTACGSTCRRRCASTPARLVPAWAPFPAKLSGHDYMAMRIDQPDLVHANPFVLLADGIPGARADMAHYTLVVVGAPDGFVLLAGRAAGITNRGSGEELQDHACAAAH